jgi:hypothetical protein
MGNDLHLPPARQTQRHHKRPPDIDQSGTVILGHAEISGGAKRRCGKRAGCANRRGTHQEPDAPGTSKCDQGLVGCGLNLNPPQPAPHLRLPIAASLPTAHNPGRGDTTG